MSYINTVIDKIYVINLDSDTERLQRFDKQMNRNKLSYVRFPAILGAAVGYNEGLTKFCNMFCTGGVKGCALSHKAIWEDMIRNRYENVLIFEDDAILSDDFEKIFREGWSQLPNDYDILYLGCHARCENSDPTSKILNVLDDSVPEKMDTHLKKVKGSIGTHGYVISSKCAKILVDTPINTHIDYQMTTWAKNMKLSVYSVTPLIVRTEMSSQTESNLSDSYPMLLNTLLHPFHLFNEIPLDRALSENWFQIFGYTINILTMILSLLIIVLPKRFVYYVFGWLLIELLYSRDFKTTWKYALILGIISFFSSRFK
jgi:GR25 family glycosyltransferase involved in LPS biosynthesis